MTPSTLFFDEATGELDTDRIIAEAIPLAKLIGLVVAVAIVPFGLAFALSGIPEVGAVGVLFAIVAQFILAVGAGLVLLYVVSRAIQIADEE